MALIGLLLIAVCLGVGADVVVENAGHLVTVLIAQQEVTDRPLAAVFVAGAMTGLFLALGLGLFVLGIGRLRHRPAGGMADGRGQGPPAPVTPLAGNQPEPPVGTERTSA
jgi:hypothetical protein